jgi:hypothetical protein
MLHASVILQEARPVTEADIIKCVAQYASGIDADRLRRAAPRLLERMRQTGLDKVPLSVGSVSEIFVLTHYLETSLDRQLRKQLKPKAHDFRNTLYWYDWLPELGGWHYWPPADPYFFRAR